MALSHGDLAIQVGASRDAKGKGGKKVLEIPQTTSVSELVNALNEIGVAPKDLTAIFQNLKSSGCFRGRIRDLVADKNVLARSLRIRMCA